MAVRDAADPSDVFRDVSSSRGDSRRDNACGGGLTRGRGGGGGGVTAGRRGGYKGRLYGRAATLGRRPLWAFGNDDNVVRRVAQWAASQCRAVGGGRPRALVGRRRGWRGGCTAEPCRGGAWRAGRAGYGGGHTGSSIGGEV